MSEWVWFAGGERLRHLALMQASAASLRFARLNIFLLSLGLGLVHATSVPFHWARSSPALEPTGSIMPRGAGWLLVASAPRPLPPNQPAEIPVDLWWNPLQALLLFGLSVGAVCVLASLVLGAMRAGLTAAHHRSVRDERRMTAALHYGAAWALPVVVAALLLGLRPLSYLGAMARWSWHPPEIGFVLSAAVVAALAGILWWFWMVRLGATAPPPMRARVVAAAAIGGPLLVGVAGAAWWWGLDRLHPWLFRTLGIAF
jgi:hypothetical protein